MRYINNIKDIFGKNMMIVYSSKVISKYNNKTIFYIHFEFNRMKEKYDNIKIGDIVLFSDLENRFLISTSFQKKEKINIRNLIQYHKREKEVISQCIILNKYIVLTNYDNHFFANGELRVEVMDLKTKEIKNISLACIRKKDEFEMSIMDTISIFAYFDYKDGKMKTSEYNTLDKILTDLKTIFFNEINKIKE